MKPFAKIALIVLFIGLFNFCRQQEERSEDTPLPNIVLIVADDLGYPYAGFMGHEIVQTPNLDRLADQGTVFRTGMVTESHCAPSLRTIITGLHAEVFDREQERFKRQNRTSETAGLSEEDSVIWEQEFQWRSMRFFKTLPQYLAEKGYTSFQGGKWWEFSYENGGFTDGMSTGWTKEDRKTNNYFRMLMGNKGLDLGRVTNQPVYDFIDEQGDNPFFIWYAPDLPHYPLNAPDEYYNIYKDQPLSESAKRYYANASWFDDEIGEVVDYFEEKGLMENTIFIYVNDNGWDQEPTVEYRHDSLRWHNGGPKGKGSYYDMTFHTPIFFSWKGTLPAEQVKDELVSSMDILPTVLDYVGIERPAGFSGNSLRPNIEGSSATGHEALFGRITQLFDPNDKTFMGKPAEGYWMRTPDYHYVWDIGNNEELLFDMINDPANEINIVNENPELVAEFKSRIRAWQKEVGIEVNRNWAAVRNLKE